MKKNNQILLSWLVIAITLITSFSSCAIDNPLQPFDDGGGPYVFKDEMDPTVKPGDDFYNYVLGTWLKENDYNLCHEDRGTMIQQYILGIEWLKKVVNVNSPDPAVADLCSRLTNAKADFEANLTSMKGKLELIDGLTTKEQIAMTMGLLLRAGYQPGLELSFNGTRKAIYMYMGITVFKKEVKTIRQQMEALGFSNDEIEILTTWTKNYFPKDPASNNNKYLTISDPLYWTIPENLQKAIPYEQLLKAGRRAGEETSCGVYLVEGLGVTNAGQLSAANSETFEFIANLDELLSTLVGQFFIKSLMKMAVIVRDADYILANKDIDLVNILNNDYTPLRYQLNKLYVEQNITSDAIAYVNDMCEQFRTTFANRIARLDWMGNATKQRALQKLAAVHFIVGAPKDWDAGLMLSPANMSGSAYDLLCAYQEAFWPLALNNLVGQPQMDDIERCIFVHNSSWDANAFYTPGLNTVMLLGSNLLYPITDRQRADEYNYAVIGATTIGHELTHGFDNTGSTFDENGQPFSMFTIADSLAYDKKMKQMISHFSSIKLNDNVYIDGKKTLGENIADLGGLEMAIEIIDNKGKEKGLSRVERQAHLKNLLLYFAQAWKSNRTLDFLLLQLAEDNHSPEKYRVNGQVNNIDVWYDIFGVTSQDKMYIAPENRIHIW